MKTTTNARIKPTDRKRLSLAKTTFRTALGNGSRILDGVDGRSLVARRYGEVAAGIATDLGGDEHLTELQQHLIRSVAGLVVLRERLDAASINGDTVNTTDYCRLANATRRVAATLGLARLTRDVTPHPLDYARAYDAEAEELEEAQA